MSAPPPPPPGQQPPPSWQAPPQPGWQAPPQTGYPGMGGLPSGVHPDGRPKGFPPAVSVAVLGFAVLLVALAGFFVIRAVVETLAGGEDIDIPGERTIHLDSGGWRVYEENGGLISGPDVSITGPDGDVALRRQPFGTSETLDVNGRSYVAIWRFDIDEAGDYTVTVQGEPSSDLVRIARSPTFVFGQWPWMLAGALGGLLIIVGIVVTIFSFRNRGRARRYAASLSGSTPG